MDTSALILIRRAPPRPHRPWRWRLGNPRARIINSKRRTSPGRGPLTREEARERRSEVCRHNLVLGQDGSSPNETPGHYLRVYCLSRPGEGRDQLDFRIRTDWAKWHRVGRAPNPSAPLAA